MGAEPGDERRAWGWAQSLGMGMEPGDGHGASRTGHHLRAWILVRLARLQAVSGSLHDYVCPSWMDRPTFTTSEELTGGYLSVCKAL